MLAPIDVSEPVRELPKPEVPPARYGLGIGSPEDSLQNCLRLVPKPPKRDNYRWQKLVRRAEHAPAASGKVQAGWAAREASGRMVGKYVRPSVPARLPCPPLPPSAGQRGASV
jgi:hypothetical protein